jgi:CMP-N,N'-diacetyllegionaminic acid synthase
MPKSIRVLGIIPARGGSRRVPRKNISKVAGKPLISYAIKAAQDSKVLDACIVSTDDSDIAAIAQKAGADVPFLRPKKYATDQSPDIEYVQHALAWLKENRDWSPTIIVLLPPDVPLRTGKDIDAVVRFMIKHKFDSVRTIAGPLAHPLKALWVLDDADGKRIKPLFPEYVGKPSQQVPAHYIASAFVYATHASFIAQGTLWGPNIGGYVIPMDTAIDIDEPEQLRQAEVALRKRKK